MSGFLPIRRDEFSDYLWNSKKSFDFFDAYLDLQQLACFMPTRTVLKNKLIYLNVGELVASERFLEKRWGWSRSKVRNFLSNLKADHKLDQRKDHGETVLILCAYWVCGDGETGKEPPTGPPKEPPTRPSAYHPRTKEEEGKEGEEEKKSPPAPRGGALGLAEMLEVIPEEASYAQAATEWAEYKATLPASQRYRSEKSWLANLKRMERYPNDVLTEAVDLAISSGWKGWEQDSVKAHSTIAKADATSGFTGDQF